MLPQAYKLGLSLAQAFFPCVNTYRLMPGFMIGFCNLVCEWARISFSFPSLRLSFDGGLALDKDVEFQVAGHLIVDMAEQLHQSWPRSADIVFFPSDWAAKKRSFKYKSYAMFPAILL